MNKINTLSSVFRSGWTKMAGVLAVTGWVVLNVAPLPAAMGDYNLSQSPLYLGQSQPPLMMMVMSRDEQLFNKAYSDYTALVEGGPINTTYVDTFNYSGYFDSKRCYSYASSRFKSSGAAGGANEHSCSGDWSGNFLNWVTMSRLDILRSVLYGGQRSTDTATTTVLERAPIPSDLHAWVKVYTGTDINQFTPYSSAQSFCNVTRSDTNSGAPSMRIASGVWSEWASTSLNQCGRARTDAGKDDTPRATTDRIVRVEVCDPTLAPANQESFCQRYSEGTTNHYKPVGLLQQYGESGRLRFGLISGSYGKPRDGGVLRRNIGKIAGNGVGVCQAGDEVNTSTGQFCIAGSGNVATTTEGIIHTISNFNLTQWNGSSNWNDCNNYSILNRQGQGGNGSLNDPGTGTQNCSAWGNPLAEMYSEALRYIGDIGSTRAGSYTTGSDLAGLPSASWQDPYRDPASGGNSFCATCSILVMSSGLPSFDSDNVMSVPHLSSAAAATTAVGAAEGINGGSYMVGRVGATARYQSLNTHEDICQARTVTDLGLARGICPDIPSMEGSYLIAGLANEAATTDLRPGLQGKPDDYPVTAQTYAVALAESLPKFDVQLGTAGKISLSPLCQANNTGGATSSSSGWRSCFLGSVGIGPKTSLVGVGHKYGRDLRADGRAGSFSLVWEDSLWGNDHDNDVVSMLTYCVGATCDDQTNPRNTTTTKDICWRSDSPVCATAGNLSVGDDEVLVRIENLSAYAGNAMLTGYTISGSNAASNLQRLALRPGGSDGSVLSSTEEPPTTWAKPKVIKYRVGNASAGSLESPLWYAAKYGAKDANKNGIIEDGEWDSKVRGTPDNYFFARNPALLKARLGEIFERAAASDAPVSGGAAGARISTNSFTVSANYKVPNDSNDWTGDVSATGVAATGSDGAVLWSAAAKLDPGTRNVFMTKSITTVNAAGTVVSAQGSAFTQGEIPGTTNAQKLASMGLRTVPTWFGLRTPADLVNYIKGFPIAGLRQRTSIMGDVVNSSPEVVTPRDDYGYGAWNSAGATGWKAALGTSYKQFLTAKTNGGDPSMVYVGANDGMLHAFNASMNSSGGTEEFAFIPEGALSHIAELANPGYVHRYYVDGLLTASDAYFDDDWHSVLVGSTGAGGAGLAPSAAAPGAGSVFGLNISNPTDFDADDVLWELSGKTDNDLGFVLGKPVIVPVATASGSPRFVALFGNGVNSTNGRPALFVVDIHTGEVIRRLAPTGSGYASRNGLMNIAPIAVQNSDGLVDAVYGGDMQGNLWKFDLSAVNPADWEIAFSGAPLFTANGGGAGQPITGGIEVTSGPGGGVSVFFGTGRYFEEGDNTGGSGQPVQSLYGIWDNLSTPVGGRDELIGQQLLAATSSSSISTLESRVVTGNAVSYVTKRGWYVDLQVTGRTAVGERFFGTPSVQNGKVFFTTFTPGDATCGAGGGINWLYGLNLLSGAGSMSGVTLSPGGDPVCTGDCGAVSLNNADNPTSPPVKDASIFVPKLTPCNPADPDCTVDDVIRAEQCTFVLRAVGAPPLYMPRPCGRQSWRQVR
jgi:type IV pilus assembly protein PilY1